MRHGQGAHPYSNCRVVHRAIVNLAPGQTQLEHVNLPCNAIVCSVVQGGIQVFLGAGGGSVPDYHFGQSNRPVEVLISEGSYDFTLKAVGPPNPVTGSVHWLYYAS